MPYVNTSGIKLYFEETGSGYPIVFVHEFGSDCREWETQVRYFSRGYRCITYNARGYPPSDVPEDTNQYGWEFSVDDVAAVMQGLSIERAHVVGLSMGGVRCSAVRSAISRKSKRDCRRRGGLRLSAVPARSVAEGNAGARAQLYRARNGCDGSGDGASSDAHPTQI
jgi:hypothetical protein